MLDVAKYNNGNVGIGTTNPSYKLEVNGNIRVTPGSYNTIGATINDAKGSIAGVIGVNTALGAYGYLGSNYFGGGGGIGVLGIASYGVVGRGGTYDFYADGAGVNYGVASSIRWKENITPIDNALDKVLALHGVYYDWKKDYGGKHGMGMIAEEVGKIVPEIVSYEDNGIDATGMDYGHLTPILVEAIKEQQKQIEELRNEIKNLKAELNGK